jgi:hypothetical protein
MNRHRVLSAMLAGAVLFLASLACEPAGVGDPCTPEVRPTCVGEGDARQCDPWAYGEVSVETRSLQCKTRTCMVYHFFPSGPVEQGEPDWRIKPGVLGNSWPPDPPAEGSAQAPCRGTVTNVTENFVKNFCKWIRDPLSGTYAPDMGTPIDHPEWYCNFDMSLVNLSQPFCTLKCGGAGRTFECPEGFVCKEVVRMGPEGMRGSYCVPARLVDCDPRTPGEQDCCQQRASS